MNTFSFLKTILFALIVVLFSSCDNDFNGIGANIVGQNNFDIPGEPFQVSAFNQKLGPVQSNNLPINPLGIYSNSSFGTSTANFATQLELATVNPTIDPLLNPVISSVALTIPYFSHLTGQDSNGIGLYKLDSIYGGANSKLKLSIYESKYFIRGFDVVTQESISYYNDMSPDFESNLGTLLAYNPAFEYSTAETSTSVTASDGAVTTTKSGPTMNVALDIPFFKTKILEAPAGQLLTNDAFRNYLRGLYFKVEKTDTDIPSQVLMDFKKGKITITYKEDLSTTDHTEANRVTKTIVLNLAGNTVSLVSQSDINAAYTTAINAPNSTAGDASLFLKGGEGSMAVINLFGTDDVKKVENGVLVDGTNGVSDELDALRVSKRLINDATLTVSIDRALFNATETVAGSKDQPNRLYLYDLDNKKQLFDYNYDGTTSSSYKYNKFVHGGIINKTTDQYKIKLTNHIRNLVLNDTVKNVKLGLVVTENINDVSNLNLKTSIPLGSKIIKTVPRGAVLNPLGTILFGSNILSSDVNFDKRMKFEIYYTQPN